MFNIYATDYAPVDPVTPPCDIKPIFIGYKGENKARCLVFDLTDCVQTFGDGGFVVSFIRQGDEMPYLVTDTDRLDNNAIWIINSTDTAVDGYGMVQLQYIVDNVICKSAQYRTVTFDSNGINGDVPDPYEDLLAQIAAYAAAAEGAATTANAAAETATNAVEAGITAERSQRIAADEGLQNQITELKGLAGAPSMAATAAAMTDSNKVYVYTGNEAGYTAGHWYYYSGTEWVDGGVYQATAVQTDPTLSVAGMAADAAATGDLKSQIYSAFVTESIEDTAIASFDDGADDVPVKDLVVNIQPKQAGTGDPSPSNVRAISGWTGANIYDDPAYGGLIKWQQLCGGTDDNAWSGVTYTNNHDGSVTFNGTATGNNSISLIGAALYASANHVYLGYLGGIDSLPTNARLTMGGLSLVGTSFAGFYKNTPNYARLGFRIDFKTGDVFNNLTFIPQLFDLTDMFGEEVADYVYWLEQSHVDKGVEWFKNIFYKDYYAYSSTSVTTTASAVNGDPYNLYNVSFGSAGTVYGGTLDVTSGMLTVTHGGVNMGSLNWIYYTTVTNPLFRVQIPERLNGEDASGVTGICSVYQFYRNSSLADIGSTMQNLYFGFQGTSKWVNVRDDSYTDVASFKAAVNGQIMSYPLENPISYQLSETEVRTLLANNNIWSDTGSVASLEYRADTKLYLENLTKPDSDMTADSNIASGSYFMVNNTLYLATAAIASGATIVPGTNCTATNLAAALNAIK